MKAVLVKVFVKVWEMESVFMERVTVNSILSSVAPGGEAVPKWRPLNPEAAKATASSPWGKGAFGPLP